MAHEREQVCQGFLVGFALLLRELAGAFVKLGCHLVRFGRRTAQGGEEGGKFGEGHDSKRQGATRHRALLCKLGRNNFNALDTDARHRLAALAAVAGGHRRVADVPQDVIPFDNLAKAVYWRSKNRASPRQMKNCEPAESGCWERAIERTPRTWGLALNSALIL